MHTETLAQFRDAWLRLYGGDLPTTFDGRPCIFELLPSGWNGADWVCWCAITRIDTGSGTYIIGIGTGNEPADAVRTACIDAKMSGLGA